MITRLPHRKRPGRAIKRFLGWAVFVVAVFMLTVTLLINSFFSPDKLSKMVKGYVAEALDAEVDFSHIEMSVFSSFPNVEIRMENPSFKSNVLPDSLQPNLLDANLCVVDINPFALMDKVVDVKNFQLDSARIVLLVDKANRANWDVVVSDTTVAETPDSLTDGARWRVRLDHVDIRKGHFVFDDRSMDFYTHLNDINIALNGDVFESRPRLTIDLQSQDIVVRQQRDVLLDSVHADIHSSLSFSKDSMLVRVNYADCRMDGMKFSTDGTLRRDTVPNTSRIDLNFRMHIDSLTTLLEMVPSYILKKEQKPEVTGEIFCKGTMNGLYGHGNYPLISAQFRVKDGSIAYPDMQYKVDSFSAECKSVIDLQKRDQSYVQLDSLYVKGGHSEFRLAGDVNDLLGDIVYQMEMQADVNLDDITKIFPLSDSVVLRGVIAADLRAKARHEDIAHADYGKVRLGGFLKMDQLDVFIPNDSVVMEIKLLDTKFGVNRKNEDILQGVDAITAQLNYSKMNVSIGKQLAVRTDASSITARTSPLYDTTMVASISSKVDLGRTVIIIDDTLLLGVKKLDATAKLLPSKRDKRVPRIETTARVDSLRLRAGLNQLAVDKADIELNATRSRRDERVFIPSGEFDFVNLYLFTPNFPLRMSMPGSHVKFDRREIEFESAHLIAGESDVYLTGSMRNMWRAFFRQDTVYADIRLKSKKLDCNELLLALNRGETYAEEMRSKQEYLFSLESGNMDSLFVDVKSDTVAVAANRVLALPKRVDFKIGLEVDKVLFDDLDIENIKGDVLIKNEVLETVGMNMRAAAAAITATISYCAADSVRANVGFDITMQKIQVDSLVTMLHSMDSILPMLHSFAGQVDFRMAAEVELDSMYDIQTNTLNGAAYLDGENMVVMDNETFSSISKLLMFKNKKKNVIDKVSVDMVVRNGVVEIYPFEVNMDRYEVAVGGSHNIGAEFKYHITIFKPQLIAGTVGGVSIKGNADNLSYYPTKARYRSLDSLSRRSDIINEQAECRNKIIKWTE